MYGSFPRLSIGRTAVHSGNDPAFVAYDQFLSVSVGLGVDRQARIERVAPAMCVADDKDPDEKRHFLRFERAAFLLHDVFGLEFEEVAATIQRDAATYRQLAGRRDSCPRDATALQGGKQHSLAKLSDLPWPDH